LIRVILINFLAVCIFIPVQAQIIDRDAALTEALKSKNTVDITFGGSGLVISGNYRRKLIIRPAYYMNVSIGVGTVPLSGGVVIPHQISMNLGRRKNYLELGMAGTYWTGLSNTDGIAERIYSYQFSPLLGYRRHFFNQLVFRAYFNPLFHLSGEYYLGNKPIIPYLGLSLGHSF
jgi:hypothetical protein